MLMRILNLGIRILDFDFEDIGTKRNKKSSRIAEKQNFSENKHESKRKYFFYFKIVSVFFKV